MQRFLRIDNYIINTDKIIDIQYLEKGFDEETGRFHIARLEITTTAIETDDVRGWNSEPMGAASKSVKFSYLGDRADFVWDWLNEHLDMTIACNNFDSLEAEASK